MKFCNRTFCEGVFPQTEILVIPRQDTDIDVPPPDYMGGTEKQYPAGRIKGKGRHRTILRFGKVQGAYIQTEMAGALTVGAHWNQNNKVGDTTLRSLLCAEVEDIGIVGSAMFAAHPFTVPGENGMGHPDIAKGIWMHGTGCAVRRTRLNQIPGTAIAFVAPSGKLASNLSVFDGNLCYIEGNHVSQALDGIFSGVGLSDVKIIGNVVYNVARDGITTFGGVLARNHAYGADRAAVIHYPTEMHDNYLEAARIGCYFGAKAGGSTSDGHNIGPGTCKIGIHADCQIDVANLFGTTAPNGVGVLLNEGTGHHTIQGRLGLGVNSVGVELRAHTSDIVLPFTSMAAGKTGIKVYRGAGNYQFNRNVIRTKAFMPVNSGPLLDLTESNLDRPSILGEQYCNEFHLRVHGDGQKGCVIYPGGGTKFNLFAGNKVIINGELQS